MPRAGRQLALAAVARRVGGRSVHCARGSNKPRLDAFSIGIPKLRDQELPAHLCERMCKRCDERNNMRMVACLNRRLPSSRIEAETMGVVGCSGDRVQTMSVEGGTALASRGRHETRRRSSFVVCHIVLLVVFKPWQTADRRVASSAIRKGRRHRTQPCVGQRR